MMMTKKTSTRRRRRRRWRAGMIRMNIAGKHDVFKLSIFSGLL